MKRSIVLVAALLAGCTSYEVVEVPEGPRLTIASRPDPAASMMLKCDMLGFMRGSDGHRLCVMRGVDRLSVAPEHEIRLPRAAPIRILPNPYPPLAPSSPCIGCVYPGVR